MSLSRWINFLLISPIVLLAFLIFFHTCGSQILIDIYYHSKIFFYFAPASVLPHSSCMFCYYLLCCWWTLSHTCLDGTPATNNKPTWSRCPGERVHEELYGLTLWRIGVCCVQKSVSLHPFAQAFQKNIYSGNTNGFIEQAMKRNVEIYVFTEKKRNRKC